MAKQKGSMSAADLIASECLAVRVRTLNRAVTNLYDEALRPHGVRAGQLNLLVAIAKLGTASPAGLCRVLRMDKSTLSRDAEVMRRNGWLELADSGDARARPLRLSAQGQALLEAVVPAWREAQAKARTLIGNEVAGSLGRAVDRLWNDGASAE
jgi:DNA-binding MarR family transcriptional regulator